MIKQSDDISTDSQETSFVSGSPSNSFCKSSRAGSKTPTSVDPKTKMCKNVLAGKVCKFAKYCPYAHTLKELRAPRAITPDFEKFCPNFLEVGFCQDGKKCLMKHVRNFGRKVVFDQVQLSESIESNPSTNLEQQLVKTQIESSPCSLFQKLLRARC